MLAWLSAWSEVQTYICPILPLTVSYFSKIQIGFSFLVRPTRVVPEKGPLNVCVCYCSSEIDRLHHCCHLPNNIENNDYMLDILYTLQQARRCPLRKLPLWGLEDLDPPTNTWFLGHLSPYPKWHFDWSVRFYTAHSCVQPTDTKTTLHL